MAQAHAQAGKRLVCPEPTVRRQRLILVIATTTTTTTCHPLVKLPSGFQEPGGTLDAHWHANDLNQGMAVPMVMAMLEMPSARGFASRGPSFLICDHSAPNDRVR